MEDLLAEIARKKNQIAEKDLLGNGKKYFKRKDLSLKLEDEYWKRNKVTILAKGEVGENSLSNSSVNKVSEEVEEKKVLPRKEVIRRLRERDEPIMIFGETEEQAYERLKKLEISMPEVIKGFDNDLKLAMERVDQQYLENIIETGDGESDPSRKHKLEDYTMEDVIKEAENFGHGHLNVDCEVILKFLKLVLSEWGHELENRAKEEKRTSRGKLESATHGQTVSYIKPLFRKLKTREISKDILECMVDIVKYLLERNYIKANDAYLEMAIGNAPWPIGVTMVGIHARTGREKIFDRNIAHVLNDETQRKYIQALKRLMTKCQHFYSTDPSRSVNFEGTVK